MFAADLPDGAGMLILNSCDGKYFIPPEICVGTWRLGKIDCGIDNVRLASLRLLKSQLIQKQIKANEDLEGLKKITLLQDNSLCTLCKENAVNTLFLECAQFDINFVLFFNFSSNCCDTCANKLAYSDGKCPKCKIKITRVVKTFHS